MVSPASLRTGEGPLENNGAPRPSRRSALCRDWKRKPDGRGKLLVRRFRISAELHLASLIGLRRSRSVFNGLDCREALVNR